MAAAETERLHDSAVADIAAAVHALSARGEPFRVAHG